MSWDYCPDCSHAGRRVLHADERRCPFRGYAMPVPCRGSTLQESIRGLHTTMAPDRYCDACRARNLEVRNELAAREATRLAARGDGAGTATTVPAPTSASLLLGDASRGVLPVSPATSREVLS